MTVEVKRAYFNALATRKLVIEIIKEDRLDSDGDAVGELRLSLYGTRDAAHTLSERVASQLQSCGYVRGRALPAVYHNESKGVSVVVHCDDYMCESPRAGID